MPTAAWESSGGSSLRRGRCGNRAEGRERDEVQLHHGRMRRGVDRQGVEVADASAVPHRNPEPSTTGARRRAIFSSEGSTLCVLQRAGVASDDLECVNVWIELAGDAV